VKLLAPSVFGQRLPKSCTTFQFQRLLVRVEKEVHNEIQYPEKGEETCGEDRKDQVGVVCKMRMNQAKDKRE
jgi:hypothetical protein